MASYDEKIKDLRRQELKLKIAYYKNRVDSLALKAIDAQSLEEFELLELKQKALERRIAELERELVELG